MVNVHDLTVFAPITSLEKARGATMFVLDLQVKYHLTSCLVIEKMLSYMEYLTHVFSPKTRNSATADKLCLATYYMYFEMFYA